MAGNILQEKLQEISRQVQQGGQPTETVRALLSWYWDSQRRGRWIVRAIRNELDRLKLDTQPNFEWAYIDGPVTFVPKAPPPPQTVPESATPVETEASHGVEVLVADAVLAAQRVFEDPTYRIGKLASANRRPVWVAPDATVSEAITIMLANDFSQLPVMTSEREVKGLISWKSLGSRLSLGQKCQFVRECMDSYYEMSAETSLFYAIEQIVRFECILVRDPTQKITGIVTASDLGIQFGQLSEPFLLLGEIENHIRDIIDNKFAPEELAAVRDPGDSSRDIQDVTDLTFGEYLRLLEDPARWEKLGITIHRTTFTRDLDEIRRIRNDVMHFDPDGIAEAALATLRRFVQFLQRFRQLSSKD
jgi:CBS domain-containing protein